MIPGVSHPDESDVSLVSFQVVGFFITETVLFFWQPDLGTLCTLRMEALCFAVSIRQTPGWAALLQAVWNFLKQSMGQLQSYGKGLTSESEPRLLRPGWSRQDTSPLELTEFLSKCTH